MSAPTIRDVAAAAGVSRASAQRALANSPRCAPETRKKVLEAAERLGYRPDPVFASMGSRRRNQTAGGLPLAFLDAHALPGGSYYEYAAARARALGYDLHRLDLNEWECTPRFWDILFARGYAGIVTGRLPKQWATFLAGNERFPVVCCGSAHELPFHSVRSPAASGVLLAWERMVALGYRRIGAAICRHAPIIEDDRHREGAVMLCQKEHASEVEPVPIYLGSHVDVDGFSAWYLQHRPEAVLGFSAAFYYRLLEITRETGGSAAFASLHVRLGEHPGLSLAGVTQHPDWMGQSAINLIDQMIRHGERGIPETPIVVNCAPQWVDGASLPPVGSDRSATGTRSARKSSRDR